MRNEVRGIAALVADTVDVLSKPVEQTHRMAAAGILGALGPAGVAWRARHESVLDRGYGALRGLTRAVATVTGSVAVHVAAGREVRGLDASVVGSGVVSAFNGLLGDRLAAAGNDLDLGMTLRQAGRDVSLHPVALAAAHPAASDHLVVFAHGLGETEHSWRLGGSEDEPAVDYGVRLLADLGATPLYLRYNTGLPLVQSGAALTALLIEVVAQWPVPVRRIDLVGHSMGGLVIRHACHQAALAGVEWPMLVGHVVHLGVPHRGAPLAKGATALAALLVRRPESRPWGELLDLRSAGVHDLTLGASEGEVPLLATAAHHTVAAEITASAGHPVGWVLGDLIVRSSSAGHGHTDRRRIGRAFHLDLLNHPEVYAALRSWLAEDHTRTAPAAVSPSRS